MSHRLKLWPEPPPLSCFPFRDSKVGWVVRAGPRPAKKNMGCAAYFNPGSFFLHPYVFLPAPLQCYAKTKLSLLFFKNPKMPLIPKNLKTLTFIFFLPTQPQLPVQIFIPCDAIPELHISLCFRVILSTWR